MDLKLKKKKILFLYYTYFEKYCSRDLNVDTLAPLRNSDSELPQRKKFLIQSRESEVPFGWQATMTFFRPMRDRLCCSTTGIGSSYRDWTLLGDILWLNRRQKLEPVQRHQRPQGRLELCQVGSMQGETRWTPQHDELELRIDLEWRLVLYSWFSCVDSLGLGFPSCKISGVCLLLLLSSRTHCPNKAWDSIT